MSLASVLSALALRAAFNAGVPLLPLRRHRLFRRRRRRRLRSASSMASIIAKLKVPAFIVTLGTSFIVRGVALLMSENTTVIGLPQGIRAYGNEALIYLIRGEGGGLYFLAPPEVTRRAAAPHGPHPALAGDRHRRRGRHRDRSCCAGPSSAGTPTPSAATWRRRCAPASRSTATSSSSTCSRPPPPASPGFLSTLRFTAGSAVIGDPLLLSSIAAVIIGGVSLFGGAGSVIGTVIGSLIIAVLTTGLVMLERPGVLAVHRRRRRRDRRGADRPVARPDPRPQPVRSPPA